MTHEWLAEVAALVGAAGAVLVFLGRAATDTARRRIRAAGRCDGDARRRAAAERRPRPARVGEGAAALVVGAGAAVAGAVGVRPLPGYRPRRPAPRRAVSPARRARQPGRVPARCRSTSCSPPPRWRCSTAPSEARSWRAIPLWIAAPAAALIGWASLSLLWALDPEEGSIALLFFLFPFAALLAVVARSPYAPWLPRALAVCLVGLATVFAAVGLYQAWSHTLVFAQDLRVANAYATYFRVTSLFKDPSIYGRQLVLALTLLVVVLWLRRVRPLPTVVVAGVIFGGLYFSVLPVEPARALRDGACRLRAACRAAEPKRRHRRCRDGDARCERARRRIGEGATGSREPRAAARASYRSPGTSSPTTRSPAWASAASRSRRRRSWRHAAAPRRTRRTRHR